MDEYNSKVPVKIGTEKNFGIVFSLFFLIIVIYKYFYFREISFIFLCLSIIFIFFSFFYPFIFKYPNILWFKLGMLLGSFISPIIMFLIYFFVFFPIGIILRIFKKDPMNIKIQKNIITYWQKKEDSKSTMKNQF